MTAALATTPAASVAGLAITSSDVVHAGNVVGQRLGNRGRAEHDQRRRAGEPLEAVAERQVAEARREPGDQQRHEDPEAGRGREAEPERNARSAIRTGTSMVASSVGDRPAGRGRNRAGYAPGGTIRRRAERVPGGLGDQARRPRRNTQRTKPLPWRIARWLPSCAPVTLQAAIASPSSHMQFAGQAEQDDRGDVRGGVDDLGRAPRRAGSRGRSRARTGRSGSCRCPGPKNPS